MDAIEHKLLGFLQQDAGLSNAELARRVGLSTAGVHKRIKRLRQRGYIEGSVTRLSKAALGLDLLCYLLITFKENMHPANMDRLKAAVADRPEVLECYMLTGQNDAIMKVLVKDHSALKRLLVDLSKRQDVIGRTSTCIVLDKLKETSCLPLTHLVEPG